MIYLKQVLVDLIIWNLVSNNTKLQSKIQPLDKNIKKLPCLKASICRVVWEFRLGSVTPALSKSPDDYNRSELMKKMVLILQRFSFMSTEIF